MPQTKGIREIPYLVMKRSIRTGPMHGETALFAGVLIAGLAAAFAGGNERGAGSRAGARRGKRHRLNLCAGVYSTKVRI